ncbi:HTH-type transcriptional activator RhaR [Paenibacillus allorhizoplanae]|uniref:HTH-type transcriptional activator RhaR n=1 Tax=Paenibacillus allorhizoplanae TaxID=2905648 RepID=A0ABN8GMR0_9BACL|nr:helix-turn-helix domain-containing protein [Paenibacillus allorhizoplanae]CAH1213066.1 HTH-type transcriptional activator RhaR [Paenibacillus allorhizoplanae]
MKNNTYIKRMMFSYLPILFLTISVLIFIFITILNELNVRNAIQANKVTTEYISNMMDNSLKTIDTDARKLIDTNMDLQAFLDSPSDRLLNYAASNILSDMMVQHNFIDSVYFYRAKDKQVLDQSKIRPLDEFPDRSYITELLNQPYSSNWSSPRFKKGSYEEDLTIKVISLGRKIPINTGSLGYMVINVKVDALSKFIDEMIDRNLTNAQIYDDQHVPFLPEVAFASSNKGVHAEVVSDYTGWTYQTEIKGGKLYSILLNGGLFWIFSILCAILLAVGSTFYVTRRNYKPIEAILHRIDRFSTTIKPADLKNDKNEFAFIDQAIERLITNNMAFQEKQQEDLTIRRQQFLQSLLNGEYEAEKEIWVQEREHYALREGTRFIAAILEMDHYVQFCLKYNQKDQSLFKFVVNSVVVEFAEQHKHQIMIEWIAKNRLVILHMSEEEQDLEHNLLKLAEQIRSWIADQLDFTVTIGIGTATDAGNIIRSFQEATHAVNRKVTLGINQIIDTIEVQEGTSSEWFTYLQWIQAVVRQVRQAESGWLDHLVNLFQEMRTQGLSKEDIDRLLHYLIFQMERELEGIMPEIDKHWHSSMKSDLLLGLEQSDTLDQIEASYRQTIEKMVEQLLELSQNRRHHVLMKEIRSFVAENFTDPNLSLTLLSDRFQVNSKYLSQLFKEEIGENFSDFLITLRMEYAKKLLIETKENVQDISERTGYTSSISFSRVFKKWVGMSPGQYRESQQ